MRVNLKISICGTAGTFEAGTVADLPDSMAVALIEGGHATANAAPAPETTMLAAPETTHVRRGRPRKVNR